MRISSGVAVVSREDGRPVGEVALPPGWYFTEAGHARVWSAVDLWQNRLNDMQQRLDTMQARIETSRPVPHKCPEPEHDPASFATASVCLGIGFLIGRAFPRRTRVAP